MWTTLSYRNTNRQWFVVHCTLQVWSCLDVLRNQLEHQWIWFKHVPHTLHLCCHWSPCQADDLLLSQHHWAEEVPSRNVVTDRNLHRHKHLCSKRCECTSEFLLQFAEIDESLMRIDFCTSLYVILWIGKSRNNIIALFLCFEPCFVPLKELKSIT